MPGFNINNQGSGPSNNTETLREHRWLIKQLGSITDGNTLLFAKELTLPDFRAERQEVLGGTLWYKFAKSVKWEDCRVLFYDTGEIVPQLYKWRHKVFNVANGIGVHSSAPTKGGMDAGYKQQCIFELLDGKGVAVHTVNLIGAWPSQISEGNLDYTSSAIKLVTVTLTYDYATAGPGMVHSAHSGSPEMVHSTYSGKS
jgi:hypothetical protein